MKLGIEIWHTHSKELNKNSADKRLLVISNYSYEHFSEVKVNMNAFSNTNYNYAVISKDLHTCQLETPTFGSKENWTLVNTDSPSCV